MATDHTFTEQTTNTGDTAIQSDGMAVGKGLPSDGLTQLLRQGFFPQRQTTKPNPAAFIAQCMELASQAEPLHEAEPPTAGVDLECTADLTPSQRIHATIDDVLDVAPSVTNERLMRSVYKQLFGPTAKINGSQRLLVVTAARVIRDRRHPPRTVALAHSDTVMPTASTAHSAAEGLTNEATIPASTDADVSRDLDRYDQELGDCFVLKQFGGWSHTEIANLVEQSSNQIEDLLEEAEEWLTVNYETHHPSPPK